MQPSHVTASNLRYAVCVRRNDCDAPCFRTVLVIFRGVFFDHKPEGSGVIFGRVSVSAYVLTRENMLIDRESKRIHGYTARLLTLMA